MTPEEAIKTIKAAQAEVEWEYTMDYAAAFDVAIKALEKQIPKEVKIQFLEMGGAITCFETEVCPTCGYDFYIDDLGQTMYCECCPNCGQALYWSDGDA